MTGKSSATALMVDGYVFGVILYEGIQVKRAWIDPALPNGTYETMTFTDDDPKMVMEKVQNVLCVRPIPEVNPADHVFRWVQEAINGKLGAEDLS